MPRRVLCFIAALLVPTARRHSPPCLSWYMTVSARHKAVTEIHLTGRAASPGLAIGPVTVLMVAVESRRATGDPAQETAALKAAIEGATAELAELVEAVQGEAADILAFQV